MKHVLLLLSLAIAASLSLTNIASAGGNAAKGEKIFRKCKVCHSVNQGGKNRIGPNLFGIVGKKSAQKAGYRYSKAMKKANLTWNEATLDKWLTKPRSLVKRTKMGFPGLKKAKQRADIIAYLETLK